LFTVLGSAVLFTLSLLSVSADRGEQQAFSTPVPSPFPDTQPWQLVAVEEHLVTGSTGTPTEAVERRTATSKHYQLAPHLFRAEISSMPVHYRDAAGQWQDINTRPVPQPGGGFRVESSNVKMTFPQKLQAGLELNATIYSAEVHPDRTGLLVQEKPDPALLFKNNVITRQTTQNLAINLPLQWLPQSMAYANEFGATMPLLQFQEMASTATENSVSYGLATSTFALEFQPTTIGFVQRLHFAAPPTDLTAAVAEGMTKLTYRVGVKAPPNVHLYTQGVLAPDSFVTRQLELRSDTGDTLLIAPALQLRDQVVSNTSPETFYQVERLPDGFALEVQLPIDWLADPNRQYPVIAESAIVIQNIATNSFNSIADTYISECSPTTNFGPNDTMWVGNFGCSGAGQERSLVVWEVESLPAKAVVFGGQTESRLWRRPSFDAGTGTITIATHRLYSPWIFNEATWLNRISSKTWRQPGAEDDYLTSPEATVGVATGGVEGYISMGPLDNLVGAWHTEEYFAPWGDPNRGVIYKSVNESLVDVHRAFGQNAYGNRAVLFVTYYDDPFNDFLPINPNTNFSMPRAPSPDYFRLNNVSGWRAFGIRPLDNRSDYDLFLSSSSNVTASIVATATKSGNVPDFVMIRPSVAAPLYPWVIQWEGAGPYYYRYAIQEGTLDLGGTNLINGTAGTFTVLSVYQANLAAGKEYQLVLNVTSGDADLGLGLFSPTSFGDFMPRGRAAALSDSPVFGGSETVFFSPSADGQYGIAIWNNGGTQDSNYQLKLQLVKKTHLPVVLKNFAPPGGPFTNGTFETGFFTPWNKADLGGPMVASVVGNLSPGCFAGGFTARLGTPGQQPNNTIPIGEVNFAQYFRVPAGASQLLFKYQVFSYDIIQGASSGRFYDRFEVAINDAPVLISGNPAGSTNGTTLWPSGCQSGSINISAFAGQDITLKFSVYNLTYPSYNTWAFVDDVRIQ
jgi:hypothetical protein